MRVDRLLLSLVAAALCLAATALVADEDGADDNSALPAPYDAIELGVELQLAGERFSAGRLGDDEHSIGAELTVSAEIPLPAGFHAFAEFTALVERSAEGDEQYRSQSWLERGEMWLRWQPQEQTTLTLGRQSFSDERQWWWDEDLDALQLHEEHPTWSWRLAFAQETTPRSTLEDDIEPEEDDLVRALAHWHWNWSAAHRIDGFALFARDRSPTPNIAERASEIDESDADLNWLGLRLSGAFQHTTLGEWRYWVDGATVRGREHRLDFAESDDEHDGNSDNNGAATAPPFAGSDQRVSAETTLVSDRERRKVRGWALDVGTSWQLPIAAQPMLFASYAVGSGDSNPDDDNDRRFRQTGLHENKIDFRYYGELFAPELSNIRVVSAGFQVPLGDDESLVGMSYHRYTRLDADAELRDAGLGVDPQGRSKDLGWEVDVVFKQEFDNGLSLEAAAAAFQAGTAYSAATDERAYRAYLELKAEF